jgi:hypothetical protein
MLLLAARGDMLSALPVFVQAKATKTASCMQCGVHLDDALVAPGAAGAMQRMIRRLAGVPDWPAGGFSR